MDPDRWQQLVLQFRQDNFKLHQLSTNSVFYVVLQAGLSALKTPYPLLTYCYCCHPGIKSQVISTCKVLDVVCTQRLSFVTTVFVTCRKTSNRSPQLVLEQFTSAPGLY